MRGRNLSILLEMEIQKKKREYSEHHEATEEDG